MDGATGGRVGGWKGGRRKGPQDGKVQGSSQVASLLLSGLAFPLKGSSDSLRRQRFLWTPPLPGPGSPLPAPSPAWFAPKQLSLRDQLAAN